MKLTRDEIVLLIALALALVVGAIVKQYRIANPPPVEAKTPSAKKK